ncbi:MAG TPA: hypothetical protein VF952_18165 [Chloroflexia bacterium]|jgi:hypothetical protein
MVALLDRVLSATSCAEAFLLSHQGADGLWRDYDLEPGQSEGWTTAFVGWAVAQPPSSVAVPPALDRAKATLHLIRTPAGWGYNRHTAADADSTAWVWRLLAVLDDYRGVPAATSLSTFLTENGAARTFLSEDRFGSWAWEHADVTPVVGLALLAVGAKQDVVDEVRRAVLAAYAPGSGWKAFWWATDVYANSQSLEFLAATGSIPEHILEDLRNWAITTGAHPTAFETAHHVAIMLDLGLCDHPLARDLVESLLSTQNDDCSWPASPLLLGPGQREVGPRELLGNADSQRLITTATVLCSLKKWLLSSRDISAFRQPPS